MKVSAAEWIYTQVLPTWYLRSVGVEDRGRAAVRGCRCTWGPCGWCSARKPEKCAHRLGTAPRPSHDTFLVGRNGGALADVSRAGNPCTWICPGPPPLVEPTGQLELFALAGA